MVTEKLDNPKLKLSIPNLIKALSLNHNTAGMDLPNIRKLIPK